MKVGELQWVSPSKLTPLPNNPRTITQADLNRLCDSLRENGFWTHRAMAVEVIEGQEKWVVLDGNQRLKAARRRKMKLVPVIPYSDLTDGEREEIILRGNINNGRWDVEKLQAEFPEVDFEGIGLEVELPEPEDESNSTTDSKDTHRGPGKPVDEEAPDDTDEDRLDFYRRLMGDYVYPTDNQYEIPVLLSDNQPVHVELPITPWGVESRYKKMMSTYHFYVDDYRFEKLFKDPIALLTSGCKAIVEPNVSIHDQTPIAYGIYQIYRKRYLTRYLQECGMQVWVDLNVSHRFAEYNRLGVPDGYNAFFTRGVSGWIPHLEKNLEMAQRISGRDVPNLCVYGGGKDIEEWCHKKGITYFCEFISHTKKPV